MSLPTPKIKVTPTVVKLKLQNANTALISRAGEATLASGIKTKAIVFGTPLPNASYQISAKLKNTSDANPIFQDIIITAQGATGFTASWNVNLDTANYVLSWILGENNDP